MATTSNSTATGPASAGLFARRSSGLVREIGLRQSLGIGLGILLLLALYSYASISLQLFPNGDYYIPILIGALIALPLAYAYIQLVGTFPRSGGEYIYASRVFAPIVGAAVGGAVFVAVCLNSANKSNRAACAGRAGGMLLPISLCRPRADVKAIVYGDALKLLGP